MRILFLEDRPDRQKIFLPNKLKDVETIKSLGGLLMPEGEICKEIISLINQKTYEFDDELKLIIIHKSALKTSGLDYLNSICKTKKITLICFSGSISQLIYNNEDFEFININSIDFYTERLIPFLGRVINNQSEHVLELINDKWKLSYLFLARQIIGSLQLEIDADVKFDFQKKLEQIQAVLNVNYSINDENIDKINFEIKHTLLQL
jgi:hypothetical protein